MDIDQPFSLDPTESRVRMRQWPRRASSMGKWGYLPSKSMPALATMRRKAAGARVRKLTQVPNSVIISSRKIVEAGRSRRNARRARRGCGENSCPS